MPDIKTLSGKSYYEINDTDALYRVNPISPDGTLFPQIWVVFTNITQPEVGLELPDLSSLGGQFNFELIIVNKTGIGELPIQVNTMWVNGSNSPFRVLKSSSVTLNGNSQISYSMFGGFTY